jgi:hypothetical protein
LVESSFGLFVILLTGPWLAGACSAEGTASADVTTAPDLVVVPAGFDGDALLGTLDSTGCFDLCTWIGAELLDEAPVSICSSVDYCLSFCALAPKLATRPCDVSLAEFATCMDAAGASPCTNPTDSLDSPACFGVWACMMLPGDTVKVAEIEHLAMRLLCDELSLAMGVPFSPTPQPTWSECVSSLLGFACRCTAEDPAGLSAGCAVTVGDALACIDLAKPGDLPDSPGCAPFRTQVSGAYDPDAHLVDLDCVQVRKLCQDSIPEQGNLPESPACKPENGVLDADYRAPVETCIASVGSLRCHCDANPAGPGCDAGIDRLQSCIADSYVDGCAYLGSGVCIAPGNQASGIPGDVKISEASADLLEQWCSWRVCFGGGPDFAGHGCVSGAFATQVPDVAGCVEDLTYHFAACDVTIADVEQCLYAVHTSDSCERLATFGACTSVENKALAYSVCHYLYYEPCDAVVNCLAAGWDIPLQPPDGYSL